MGGIGSGRLREHDRDQIAKDMLVWSLKDDSLNLNGFCAEQLIAPSKITNWAKEDDFFRQAYETVKAVLAERREKCLIKGTLHVKAYDLNACVYDHFLKEDKREQAKYEAEIKAKETEKVSEDIVGKFDQFINQFPKSSLNKPESKTNTV